MKKYTYKEIKAVTKGRVNERFGDALLITIIPGIIVFIITLFTGMITNVLDPVTKLVTDNIISTILGFFSSFAVYFMLIRFARRESGFSFTGISDKKEEFIQFVFYNLFALLFTLLALLPILHFVLEFIPNMLTITDPAVLNNYISDYFSNNPNIISSLRLSLYIFLFVGLVMVKFTFAPLLIIDQGLSFIDALKGSWKLSNGNYFRILFFPFTFFFWIILGFVTCGLGFIYVVPLIQTGQMYLYLHILKESKGDVNDTTHSHRAPEIIDDPLAQFDEL